MCSQNQFTKHQEGQTIAVVAIALVALLAMAALAIDIVTLYVSHGEAQRAANAAALAGAKLFSSSGFTSGQFGPPAGIQDQVCTAAIQQAQVTSDQNPVANQPATLSPPPSCTFNVDGNPQISVTVKRTGLPTFFARIWGIGANSVSAMATAEAYNPSGLTAPIQTAVKPLLLPNCDLNGAFPCAGNYFFDPTKNYTLNNPSAYIGVSFPFRQRDPGGTTPNGRYYVVDMPQATQCPSCASGADSVFDNIACANVNQVSCGQNLTIFAGTPNAQTRSDVTNGTQCLIHATATGPGGVDQDQFSLGPPVLIKGGDSNPDPNLQGITNISRSDSVVTVPVYAGTVDPCSGGTCQPATVIGFLQLGIEYTTANAHIQAVVINASGCNPSATGTPISGGGVSPVPVRLIGQ